MTGGNAALRAGRDVHVVDSPTVHLNRLAVNAGRNASIDVEPASTVIPVDVRELAVEAGERFELTRQSAIEIGGATSSPLYVKAGHVVLDGLLLSPSGEEAFQGTGTVDTPLLEVGNSLFFPRLELTNSTDRPSVIKVGEHAMVAAMESINVVARNGGTIVVQGDLRAPVVNLHLGGRFDSVHIEELYYTGEPGQDNTPRLRLYGAGGPGTWLEADSVSIQASGDLRLSGMVKAGDVLVRTGLDPSWGARRNLILEDGPGTARTRIDASGSVTMVAGLAFRNYTAHDGNPFPGSGRVLIFSATDRYGYDPGSLLRLKTPSGDPRFAEVYGVSYSPSDSYNPSGDTIYIGEAAPSPLLTIPAPANIEKVFDNTPVVIDPAQYVNDPQVSGLRFRFESPEGDGGINVGTYVIVPYGAESEVYRITYQGTGQLTITPRPLCPQGCAGWAERLWGDLNPNFGVIWRDVFNLAPGHTAADAGMRFTTDMPAYAPGASVGQYQVFVEPDPNHPGAKNYIFPTSAVGTIQVNRRPIRLQFYSGVINDGQVPDSSAKMWNLVRVENWPATQGSQSRLMPYLELYYTPAYTGPGVYQINYRIRKWDELLDNIIFEPSEPGVITVVANLDYLINESWKKLFPLTNVADCWFNRSCEVQQAPKIGNFSGAAWPVMGKAIATYLSVEGKLQESEFLKMLQRLTSSDPNTRNEALGEILPFVMGELEEILNRPESTWSAAERAFIEEFLRFVNDQRKEAAAWAMVEYLRWKEEQEYGQSQSGPFGFDLGGLFNLGPKPPEHLLRQAATGIFIDPSQSKALEVIASAFATFAGSAAAAVLTSQVAATGVLNAVLLKVFPFAARLTAEAVKPAAFAAGAFAGPAAIIVAGIVTIGTSIAHLVEARQFEGNLKKAMDEAQVPLTVDKLREWLDDSYEVVMGWMMLRFARPYANPNSAAWRLRDYGY